MKNIYKVGLDVGSTTAKIAVLDEQEQIVHSQYSRHHTRIHETVNTLFENAKKQLGNCTIQLAITGSAGMGISEKLNIPFVQEVIAATDVVRRKYSQVKTLIDIGGEDSKMIFFNDNKPPDIRMNGSCAGGTGAFIDQMASLMNVSPTELNELAKQHTHVYPIASRCGVFAKTDVQNLLSRRIPHTDIAASVFQAVVIQTMNTLARGFDMVSKMMFIGGPFKFLSELKKTFIANLKITDDDLIIPEKSELLPAMGAAINNDAQPFYSTFSKLQEALQNIDTTTETVKNRLKPLFESPAEFAQWNEKRNKTKVTQVGIEQYKGECFIGIDSGSTTTKITVIGTNGELLYKFYTNNNGNSVNTVKEGLQLFHNQLLTAHKTETIKVVHTAVTGYGEDLIKAAFGMDLGIVETIAHFTAAHHFNPKVSFIMDIGGQDMKAIFIKNGTIQRIELNESCSSGCGSFIQTFGKSLGYGVADFAQKACHSTAPADLGTRCTVFMNSKVKQSLRENATVEDISAGLSLSVIKNALYKVLKLKDTTELGEHIVVQGGTFRNPSILRALEMLTEKEVICSDIPELMGAYGAALLAQKQYNATQFQADEARTSFIGLHQMEQIERYLTKQSYCKGCVNHCSITRFLFDNKSTFFSGNKCENVFSNKGTQHEKGFNMFEYKYKLLFDRKSIFEPLSKVKIGIPRILNMYENYPFWHSLMSHCGFEVVLSRESTMTLYENGLGTVMSDSICFPAKLVHGHILDLIEQKVDRILYPFVVYEKNEFSASDNSFNCPIVSSYSDVLKSSMNPELKHKIPLDAPTINFNDEKLLRKACRDYLKDLGIPKAVFQKAFEHALETQKDFKEAIREKGHEIIVNVKKDPSKMLIVLAGRPYHTDKLINHKIPSILTDLGVDVLTEDALPLPNVAKLEDLQIVSQWAYPNRIYSAAQWLAEQDARFQFVQLNSFGCGPDAIVIDEVTEILKAAGKNQTLIRIDDITSTGSVKLRLRSMIESLKVMTFNAAPRINKRVSTATFGLADKNRLILGPHFAEMYSPFIPVLFQLAGYKYINLPPADKNSVEYGLKYSNNEICYPATVVVGDVIKALQSGQYKRDEVAIGITQTGGQCRATTYLSLIKKAMVSAGFEDVPVIAIGTSGKTLNPQPGFDVNWKKLLNITFVTALFADAISQMYFSTVVREVNKGTSKILLHKYQQEATPIILKKDISALFALMEEAVKEFNAIEIYTKDYPKIGIVGEIFVKYNSFGHHFIIDWLISQGIEVVVPPILEFFIQDFVNLDINKDQNLWRSNFSHWLVYFVEKYSNRYIRRTIKIMSEFRCPSKFHNVRDLAKLASRIVNLSSQFGEGWLIPAELAAFAEEGVNHVVSVQPFGCIANHIISKGIEKRIKDLYPDMSLLFLDFDDGTTEVNILNRLHFMVKNVNESMSH